VADAIGEELAVSLAMLLSVATDERSRLPRLELFTDMALNGARQALAKAKAAGIIKDDHMPIMRDISSQAG
jgi:hypothetical protein